MVAPRFLDPTSRLTTSPSATPLLPTTRQTVAYDEGAPPLGGSSPHVTSSRWARVTVVRQLRTIIGLVFTVLGMLIALFPVISVWRVSGQVLTQLPELTADVDDDRHRFAIPDPDFVLATRTYHDMSESELEAALVEAGFESTSAGGKRYLSKECCGEYDAVLVQIEEGPEDVAVATLTAADADVQLSWLFFAILGLPVMVAGAVGVLTGLRRPTGQPAPSWSGSST